MDLNANVRAEKFAPGECRTLKSVTWKIFSVFQTDIAAQLIRFVIISAGAPLSMICYLGVVSTICQ